MSGRYSGLAGAQSRDSPLASQLWTFESKIELDRTVPKIGSAYESISCLCSVGGDDGVGSTESGL